MLYGINYVNCVYSLLKLLKEEDSASKQSGIIKKSRS